MAYERERSAIDEKMTEPPTEGVGMMNQPMGGAGAGGGSANRERVRRAWREGSPDEVRDEMRRIVEKSVAALTGAIRGFTDRAREEDLPGKAGEAVQRAGETAQSVVQQTGDQARSMRGALHKTTEEVGETARDVGSTAADETQRTMSEVGEKAGKTASTAREQAENMRESVKGGSSSTGRSGGV